VRVCVRERERVFASVFSVTYESWAGKLLVSASATILCVPSQAILEFQATNSGGQIASSMAPMYTTSFQRATESWYCTSLLHSG
jgi:hypothetical protein